MSNTFVLDDGRRFARILFFAAGLHLVLLIVFDLTPKEMLPLTKIMVMMLDVTQNSKANQHSPTIALNIAPQNHASAILEATLDTTSNEGYNPQLSAPLEDKKVIPAQSYEFRHHPDKSKKDTANDVSTLNEKANRLTNDKKTPRRRTISAASHESKDAAYLARWQNYVEEYGNSHYPTLALKNNLKGDLRLLVAVNKDGSLQAISLRQSSGSPILDQAAIDIVKHAAPFEPLPPEIANDIEILEIIRTWQFRGTLSTKG